MRLKKFGCGCIGFTDSNGHIIIIDHCDRDYEGYTFSDGNNRLFPHNIANAVSLSDELSTAILTKFRHQLVDGSKLAHIKSLLGIK